MAAVPVLSRTNLLASAPVTANGQTTSAAESAKLQKALETLFPDLVVHSTRNCLLGMTTSLTRVSGEAHHYFARLAQMLAFERMMRDFMQLTAAISPFPMGFVAAHCWNSLFPGAPSPWPYFAVQQQSQAPSPWAYFAAPQQSPAPSPWGYFAAPQRSQPPSPWNYFAAPQQSQPPSPWDYFAAPQPSRPPSPWDYFAAPQPSQMKATSPSFAHALRQNQPASSKASSWPDLATMLALPAAFMIAAPVANGWWNFHF